MRDGGQIPMFALRTLPRFGDTMNEHQTRPAGGTFGEQPHAYNPVTQPQLFDAVIRKRCVAFIIDAIIIVALAGEVSPIAPIEAIRPNPSCFMRLFHVFDFTRVYGARAKRAWCPWVQLWV